jgi:integrase
LLFEAFWCLFGPSKITLAHGLCCPKITFVAPKFVANETETVRVYLTVKAIQALKLAEPGGRYDVADAIVPGFGVRVNAKGKSYTLTARFPGSTHPTRRTIAAVDEIDLATARDKARAWLVKIRKGYKPLSVRVLRVVTPKAETFEQVVTKFLEQHVHRNSLRTAHEVERIIHKDLMPLWRTRDFKSIRRGDVARMLDAKEIHAPVQADYILSVLSKLCNWYMVRDEDYVSPIVRGMRRTKPSQRARQRIFDDNELRLFWQATGEVTTYGAFVRTALLTAQRRTKVLEMRWSDINDEGVWIIPSAHREKCNAKTLGLTRLALDVIDSQPQREDSEYIFAGLGATPIDGLSKMKRALDERMEELNGAPIPPWVVHDLRRTARSLLARAGVRPDICERVLGHAIPGVWGVYDRYSYEDEKTEALSKLSDLIERIIAPDTMVANPIPMRFRQHMQPSELRVSA